MNLVRIYWCCGPSVDLVVISGKDVAAAPGAPISAAAFRRIIGDEWKILMGISAANEAICIQELYNALFAIDDLSTHGHSVADHAPDYIDMLERFSTWHGREWDSGRVTASRGEFYIKQNDFYCWPFTL